MPGIFRPTSPSLSPDLLFSNAELYDPCTCSWDITSFVVSGGYIRRMGGGTGLSAIDLHGARVIPGLIDAHVHLESSLLCPVEFGRLALSHGVTTVIADPHEIANVLGRGGIRYMLREAAKTPLDIFFMLPSCVPASSEDIGGAILTAEDLAPFLREEKVLGLGEVMDVGAVLTQDAGMKEKLRLTRIIDGHAPGLRGEELDRYLSAGIQSDHECTDIAEAREKLEKGMYILIREGSTERNLRDLLPLATTCSLPRLSFATDDRHPDTLYRHGSIDDCIRLAVAEGLELESALRMATLSPCDRFELRDRGMIAPGRKADFSILEEDAPFCIRKTYKGGEEVTTLPYRKSRVMRHRFRSVVPPEEDLRLHRSGIARVLQLKEGQILTRAETATVEGERLPDPDADLLIALVCSRYRPGQHSIGLVRGFGLQEGALASSIAHDAHNVVGVGADLASLRRAIGAVVSHNGGMATASAEELHLLPLECAGLMSSASAERVIEDLDRMEDHIQRMGGTSQAFMYLSFLTLSVIPELRITEQGLYDVTTRSRVPLFINE